MKTFIFTHFHAEFSGKTLTPFIALVFILVIKSGIFAHSYEIFPQKTDVLTIFNFDFQHSLYFGYQHDTLYSRGNFGLEFPIMAYTFQKNRKYIFGATAASHLIMIPNNLKFAVDNFYATLALYISGKETDWFSWRLYPIYHVSAHLGDGYPYDLLRKNIYAVSNERVMVECVFNPAPPFSVGIAYGRYYHTCYQKELTDRAEFSLFYETPELFFFIPYVWIRNTAINKKKWSFGFDTSVGIYTTKKKRGITMSLRYFNRLHPGYYVDRREIGTGFQLTFLP